MKVLHILDYSVPYVSGYASRSKYITDFQKTLDVIPVVLTSPRHECSLEFERLNNVDYYRTKIQDNCFNRIFLKFSFIKELIEMRALQKRLEKLLLNVHIDLIHVHSPVLWAIPALLVARKRKLPFVYEVRALWEDAAVDQRKVKPGSMRYKITHFLETVVLMKANSVVTICNGLSKEIISRGVDAKKVFVVSNGVDTSKFLPAEKSLDLIEKYRLERCFVIGFIGSFYRFEGVELLVQSMVKILKKHKNIKLLIVGHGEQEQEIKQQVEKLNLLNDILLVGRVPHDDVFKYYSVMDILVYPRINRRITNMVTPIKPLEAMSMAKPVICSDVGGLRELIVENVTGVLFESENVDNLADKIVMLSENSKLRDNLGFAARKHMESKRDWKNIISNYISVYQCALQKEKK